MSGTQPNHSDTVVAYDKSTHCMPAGGKAPPKDYFRPPTSPWLRSLHFTLLPYIISNDHLIVRLQRFLGVKYRGPLFSKSNINFNDISHANMIECHNPLFSPFRAWAPLHIILCIASELGNELFYALWATMVPLTFDVDVSCQLLLLWGLALFISQLIKDSLYLPRPFCQFYNPNSEKYQQPIPHDEFVYKLETQYSAEYGFPSSHTSGCIIPLWTMYLLYTRYLNYDDYMSLLAHSSANVTQSAVIETVRAQSNGISYISSLTFYIMFASLLFWFFVTPISRIYCGVHSVLDIVGGYAVGALCFCLIMALDSLGVVSWLYSSFFGLSTLAVIFFVLLYLYPKHDHIWVNSSGDTSLIFGTIYGLFWGVYLHQLVIRHVINDESGGFYAFYEYMTYNLPIYIESMTAGMKNANFAQSLSSLPVSGVTSSVSATISPVFALFAAKSLNIVAIKEYVLHNNSHSHPSTHDNLKKPPLVDILPFTPNGNEIYHPPHENVPSYYKEVFSVQNHILDNSSQFCGETCVVTDTSARYFTKHSNYHPFPYKFIFPPFYDISAALDSHFYSNMFYMTSLLSLKLNIILALLKIFGQTAFLVAVIYALKDLFMRKFLLQCLRRALGYSAKPVPRLTIVDKTILPQSLPEISKSNENCDLEVVNTSNNSNITNTENLSVENNKKKHNVKQKIEDSTIHDSNRPPASSTLCKYTYDINSMRHINIIDMTDKFVCYALMTILHSLLAPLIWEVLLGATYYVFIPPSLQYILPVITK